MGHACLLAISSRLGRLLGNRWPTAHQVAPCLAEPRPAGKSLLLQAPAEGSIGNIGNQKPPSSKLGGRDSDKDKTRVALPRCNVMS
jgi:hypothetical protein